MDSDEPYLWERYLSPEPFIGVYAYMITTDGQWRVVHFYDQTGATCVLHKVTSKNEYVYKMYVQDSYGSCTHKQYGWDFVTLNYYEETMDLISMSGPQDREWFFYTKDAFFEKYNDLDDSLSVSQNEVDSFYDYGYQSEYDNGVPDQNNTPF